MGTAGGIGGIAAFQNIATLKSKQLLADHPKHFVFSPLLANLLRVYAL